MKYLGLRQTARIFDRSYETIRQWCKRGWLRGHQDPITGRWYIEVESVVELRIKFERAGFEFGNNGLIDKGQKPDE